MKIQCPKCKEVNDSEDEKCIYCGTSLRGDGGCTSSDADNTAYGDNSSSLNRFDSGGDREDFRLGSAPKNIPSPPSFQKVVLIWLAVNFGIALLVILFAFLVFLD